MPPDTLSAVLAAVMERELGLEGACALAIEEACGQDLELERVCGAG